MSICISSIKPHKQGTLITVTSPLVGERIKLFPQPIQLWASAYLLYTQGGYVQEAFDFLDASGREFLMTGLSEDEFGEIMEE